jgi:hypothetical protein
MLQAQVCVTAAALVLLEMTGHGPTAVPMLHGPRVGPEWVLVCVSAEEEGGGRRGRRRRGGEEVVMTQIEKKRW